MIEFVNTEALIEWLETKKRTLESTAEEKIQEFDNGDDYAEYEFGAIKQIEETIEYLKSL